MFYKCCMFHVCWFYSLELGDQSFFIVFSSLGKARVAFSRPIILTPKWKMMEDVGNGGNGGNGRQGRRWIPWQNHAKSPSSSSFSSIFPSIHLLNGWIHGFFWWMRFLFEEMRSDSEKHQGIWPFEKHRELPRIKDTFSTRWCIEMTPTRWGSLRNGDISNHDGSSMFIITF